MSIGTTKYQELEEKYAEYVKSQYAVACSSGTSALHLALLALGVGPGDEVIVPEFTMAACAFAVSYTGAKPVFVDCDETYTIDPRKIKAAITDRTKAIMPVHIYGRLAQMDKIMALADEYGLWVVEDACEAQGAVFNSRADVTCWSFYRNKIIAAEEGGMVTTNLKDLADSMRNLKNMAFDEGHTYLHQTIGFNYRLAESQAEMALKSLKKVSENLNKRRDIEIVYRDNLPKELRSKKRDVVWVYDLISSSKDKIVASVPGARHFFKPMSQQPPYLGAYNQLNAHLISKIGCYLPVNPEMTRADVLHICGKVLDVL